MSPSSAMGIRLFGAGFLPPCRCESPLAGGGAPPPPPASGGVGPGVWTDTAPWQPLPTTTPPPPPPLPPQPPLGPRCKPLAAALPLMEVARTCSHPGEYIEDSREGCLYHLLGPADPVRFVFRGAVAKQAHAAVVREEAPAQGAPAPPLGPDGLAFYDRARGRTLFYFAVGAHRMTVSAPLASCEAGPP